MKIQIGEIAADVVRKDIKNVHLSVHPPTGRVTISAPSRMSLNTIRVFAIAKIGWIRQQQKKLLSQERETPREYLNRESHYVWGERYLMKIIVDEGPPSVILVHRRMTFRARVDWDRKKKEEFIDGWYRSLIKAAAAPLIAKWERRMGVEVERFFVQRMKTKWGSCNAGARTIRLNTDLAKKPRECLEYIVVHELIHMLEPSHNARFIALMDEFMPNWQSRRQMLNRLPVRHESWMY